MDEAFWARKEGPLAADDGAPQGDYDANFFQDDGLPMPGGIDDDDDIEFADARDHFSPGAENRGEGGMSGINDVINGGMTQGTGGEDGAFGTQLVTQSRRLRPEYVQYARVAKKVDVRRLKEELWRGMGIDDPKAVRPLSLVSDAKVLIVSRYHHYKVPDGYQHLLPLSQRMVMATVSNSQL